jgi:hypothetical protein
LCYVPITVRARLEERETTLERGIIEMRQKQELDYNMLDDMFLDDSYDELHLIYIAYRLLDVPGYWAYLEQGNKFSMSFI